MLLGISNFLWPLIPLCYLSDLLMSLYAILLVFKVEPSNGHIMAANILRWKLALCKDCQCWSNMILLTMHVFIMILPVNNRILSKANKVWEEEIDDVKKMNSMMLYARTATVRDGQKHEKVCDGETLVCSLNIEELLYDPFLWL